MRPQFNFREAVRGGIYHILELALREVFKLIEVFFIPRPVDDVEVAGLPLGRHGFCSFFGMPSSSRFFAICPLAANSRMYLADCLASLLALRTSPDFSPPFFPRRFASSLVSSPFFMGFKLASCFGFLGTKITYFLEIKRALSHKRKSCPVFSLYHICPRRFGIRLLAPQYITPRHRWLVGVATAKTKAFLVHIVFLPPALYPGAISLPALNKHGTFQPYAGAPVVTVLHLQPGPVSHIFLQAAVSHHEQPRPYLLSWRTAEPYIWRG